MKLKHDEQPKRAPEHKARPPLGFVPVLVAALLGFFCGWELGNVTDRVTDGVSFEGARHFSSVR